MNYINYKELFACVIGSFPSLFLGLNSGFSTEYIYQQGNKRELSNEMVSWIGGSGLMLSFVGCLVDGYLMDTYGRKSLLYSTFTIHFIGWMLIAKTDYFLLGRFLTGLALGLGMAATVYISEIIQPKYRGMLLLLGATLEIFGNLCMYLIEFWISAETTAFILSILAFVLFFSVTLIPETPYWYMMKKQQEKAITALVWLRDGDEMTIESEIYDMEQNSEQSCKARSITEVIFTLTWWKTFAMFSIYVVLTELSGFDMIIPYSVQFFDRINHTVVDTRVVSSIFVSAALVGSITSMFFIEDFKRKTLVKNANLVNVLLLSISGLCEALSHSAVSSAIVLICLFLYATTVSITTFSLPWTIISESLPTESRATVFAALCTEFSITYFLLVKIFPNVLFQFNMDSILWAFAFFSLMNYVFVGCFVKETRGIILPGNRKTVAVYTNIAE